MKKLALPENFDHKNIDILKQFITETGKIIPEVILFLKIISEKNI